MPESTREDIEFRSSDLGESEEFLSENYARMRIGSDSDSDRSRTEISRRWLGPMNFDQLVIDYKLDYDAAPLNRLCLVRIQAGYMEEDFIGEQPDVFLPGDVTLLSPPELPYTGRTRGRYDLTMFDSMLLDTVASTPVARHQGHVHLTDHRPVSDGAALRLSVLIDYLRDDVLTDETARRSPLVISAVCSHLASTVLATYPNDAVTDPTAGDRNSATPTLLRRAAAYIEQNIDSDLTLSAIAESVSLTPRAVSYLFRHHWDCSPVQYVRRVRLDHAHRDLVAADPTTGITVASVANRWGFVHSGRFAAQYRRTYGQDPSAALQQ